MKISNQIQYDIFIEVLPAILVRDPNADGKQAAKRALDFTQEAVQMLEEAGVIKDTATKTGQLGIRPPNKYREL